MARVSLFHNEGDFLEEEQWVAVGLHRGTTLAP
jgi:hypothetical protein